MRTRRRVWWVAALGAVILLQITVPTVALFGELPARFGFQMYSGYGDGRIEVRDASGAAVAFDAAGVLPHPLRPELDWTQYVPEHLCQTVPGAATIVVLQDGRGEVAVPCA
jgi:hypothetical protein